MTIDNSIRMYKGDNRTIRLTISGVASIVGATLKFTVKEDPTLPDTNAKIKLSTAQPTEIEITGDLTASIYLVPSHTSSLTARTYLYDIEMTLSGKVYTLVKDNFILIEDVTKGE